VQVVQVLLVVIVAHRVSLWNRVLLATAQRTLRTRSRFPSQVRAIGGKSSRRSALTLVGVRGLLRVNLG
jgi:hypothetical protein